jgi:hypothetical protein
MTDVVQSGDLGEGAARNIGRVVIRALAGPLCWLPPPHPQLALAQFTHQGPKLLSGAAGTASRVALCDDGDTAIAGVATMTPGTRSIHAVARCFDPTQRSSSAPLCATTLRLRQQIVVLPGTGSIGHRERRERIVKGVALSDISRDHGRIGRTCVRAGERAPAQAGVVYEGVLLDDLAD